MNHRISAIYIWFFPLTFFFFPPLCLVTEHCLQVLSYLGFCHKIPSESYWYSEAKLKWFFFFFKFCCCLTFLPVSVKQDYILNCCHMKGGKCWWLVWSCQSCGARSWSVSFRQIKCCSHATASHWYCFSRKVVHYCFLVARGASQEKLL